MILIAKACRSACRDKGSERSAFTTRPGEGACPKHQTKIYTQAPHCTPVGGREFLRVELRKIKLPCVWCCFERQRVSDHRGARLQCFSKAT